LLAELFWLFAVPSAGFFLLLVWFCHAIDSKPFINGAWDGDPVSGRSTWSRIDPANTVVVVHMVPSWFLSVCSLALFAAKPAVGVTLTASLDYGTFQGAYNAQYNLSYWQKIPFAAPPVGVNRFRAPQPPLPITGTYNSTQTFSECPQRSVSRAAALGVAANLNTEPYRLALRIVSTSASTRGHGRRASP
jgi:hypothetical protein